MQDKMEGNRMANSVNKYIRDKWYMEWLRFISVKLNNPYLTMYC